MKRKTFIRTGLLLLVFLAAVLFIITAPILLAQVDTNAPPVPGGTTSASSWLPGGWQNLVIALIVPGLLALAKKFFSADSANLSDMTKKVLVIAAPILGAICAALAGFFGSPVDAAHLAGGAVFGGATGIGLRELGDQLVLKPMRRAPK